MMRYCLLLCLFLHLSNCQFGDTNIDPIRITETTLEALLPAAISQSIRNINSIGGRVTGIIIQHYKGVDAQPLGYEQYLQRQGFIFDYFNNETELVEDVVFWVEKFAQELTFNQATCRRDAGLIVDALARDLYTGSNFATTKAGMSYYRLIASALKVKNEQLYATVGSMEFLAQKARRVATLPANAAIEMLIEDINAYIDGGQLPIQKWVTPATGGDANDIAAASIIWENTKFIQEDVIAFIAETYPELNYNKDKCRRDIGYIIDAIRYDLTYSGDAATLRAAEYYWTKDLNDENVHTLEADEKTATLAAYDHMKFLLEDLALNTLGSPGAVQTDYAPVFRDELQTIGDAGSSSKVTTLMTTLYNTINDILAKPQLYITDVTNNIFTINILKIRCINF